MGAFVFAVERAREDVKSRSGGRYKDIEVVIRLENYEERFQPTFDDAFNGYRPGSMMSFPKMSLIDADGHAFDGFVSPVSGGSRRSQRWIVRFSLVYGSLRESLDTDWQESAEEHVGKEIADFRLVIKNPDHRPGQPRQVWVQL
jgi:hypothetical protein